MQMGRWWQCAREFLGLIDIARRCLNGKRCAAISYKTANLVEAVALALS